MEEKKTKGLPAVLIVLLFALTAMNGYMFVRYIKARNENKARAEELAKMLLNTKAFEGDVEVHSRGGRSGEAKPEADEKATQDPREQKEKEGEKEGTGERTPSGPPSPW